MPRSAWAQREDAPALISRAALSRASRPVREDPSSGSADGALVVVLLRLVLAVVLAGVLAVMLAVVLAVLRDSADLLGLPSWASRDASVGPAFVTDGIETPDLNQRI